MATPTADQVALAERLMDSGEVDLVIGHHAHVVRPIQAFGGRYMVYGLGNFISAISHDFADGASREGIVPTFTFTRGEDDRWSVTRVDVAAALTSEPPGEELALRAAGVLLVQPPRTPRSYPPGRGSDVSGAPSLFQVRGHARCSVESESAKPDSPVIPAGSRAHFIGLLPSAP